MQIAWFNEPAPEPALTLRGFLGAKTDLTDADGGDRGSHNQQAALEE